VFVCVCLCMYKISQNVINGFDDIFKEECMSYGQIDTIAFGEDPGSFVDPGSFSSILCH